MAHWIKAHQDDPDCPPMRTKRAAAVPRAQRPPNVKAVKFMKRRYKENGDMQPLAEVCNVLDNPRTRTSARLHAAELAWEMTHGKIAPAQAVAAVQINQQVNQALEAPSEQLSSSDRARELAGLLKATAVLGDVCEGAPPGQVGGGAGGAAAGGAGAAEGGAGRGGGAVP
jgi:hypothetical protein